MATRESWPARALYLKPCPQVRNLADQIVVLDSDPICSLVSACVRSCLPVRSSRLPNDLPGHPKSGRPGVKKHADRLDSCLLANHKICQTLCTPRPGDQSLCLLTRNSGQTIPLPYRLAQTIPFGPINWPTIGFAPGQPGELSTRTLSTRRLRLGRSWPETPGRPAPLPETLAGSTLCAGWP